MKNGNRKFIIYEDVAKEVVTMLEAYIEVHGDSDSVSGVLSIRSVKNTLHHFESGLYLYPDSSSKEGEKERKWKIK